MKKQLSTLLCALFTGLFLSAQTNWFPSSGDVGIGTTTPSSHFNAGSLLNLKSAGNSEIVLDHSDGGTTSDIGIISFERNNNHLAHIRAKHDGSINSAFLSFHTQVSGGAFSNVNSNERMRITSSGNVGIGTTNPVSLFDARTTSGKGIWLNYNNESAVTFKPNNGNSIFHLSHGHDNKLYLSHGSNVGAIKLMTFVNSGKVGIGTSAPNADLHVKSKNSEGVLIIQGKQDGTVGNSASIVLSTEYSTANNTSGTQTGRKTIIKSIADSAWGSNPRLGFFTSSDMNDYPVEQMTIWGNGNVGIGTTSPQNKFHVKADDLGQVANDRSVLTTIEGSVVGNNSKFQVLNKRNDNGNSWSNTSLRLQRVIDNTPQAFIDFGIEGENSNYGLAFGTRNGFSGTQQTRMVIEENGNVGIGTTNTKGFKLGVNGKIAATEVKVATYANWPDYVFKDTYNLPALKEVERHIKEKGHLKDIPNAKEVKKDGFYLAEMNAKLLQKIEELTLYTIEQEKKLESQGNEIKELKEENLVLKSLLERVKKIEENIKL